MRLCFVGKQMLSYFVEGSCIASKRIIDASIRSGINAEVVTVEPEKTRFMNHRDWKVINCKQMNNETLFAPSRLTYLRDFVRASSSDLQTCLRVAAWIKSSTSDMVHVLNVNKEAFLFAHKLLRINKPSLFHFYHSPEVLNDDVFFVRSIAMKAGLYGRSYDNHVLTVNASMFRFLLNKMGLDNEHVHFAPYPVDISVFKPSIAKVDLRRKYGLPFDSPVLVYLGSLNPARGLFDLIKSFRHVLRRFPHALLFISHPERKGEELYMEGLLELARSLKVQTNSLIRGSVPNIEEILNLADAVVLPFVRPYWVDPPLVLLEAMAAGCPVVTTPVGSIGEVIANHENGILAEPSNPSSLARETIELLENPEESKRIREAARKTIVKNYSFEEVGKRLSRIYGSIMNS